MSTKPRIYMAGPLFTAGERSYNEYMCRELTKLLSKFEFVLPQVRAADIFANEIGTKEELLRKVVDDCLKQVEQADLILACLDGPDADSGTCVEVGYAIARNKDVLGYRTDFRVSEADGVNAMLRYGCKDYVAASSLEVSPDQFLKRLAEAIERLLR